MKLVHTLTTDLARLRSNIASLQKEEKELTEKCKKAMKAEGLVNKEYAPRQSPYKFCLDKLESSKVKWKDEWKKLAKKYISSWKKMEASLIEDSRETQYRLRVEPNENYKEE